MTKQDEIARHRHMDRASKNPTQIFKLAFGDGNDGMTAGTTFIGVPQWLVDTKDNEVKGNFDALDTLLWGLTINRYIPNRSKLSPRQVVMTNEPFPEWDGGEDFDPAKPWRIPTLDRCLMWMEGPSRATALNGGAWLIAEMTHVCSLFDLRMNPDLPVPAAADDWTHVRLLLDRGSRQWLHYRGLGIS